MIEQTRVFHAPVSGEYTFRTRSDDGSWLWVNGRQVVLNHGLHRVQEATGTIYLDAGLHVLSLKYFEHTGAAEAGYDVQIPGRDGFSTVVDGFRDVNGLRVGNTFLRSPEQIVVGADDMGGTGVSSVRYSLNGSEWFDSPGNIITLGRVHQGSYTLRYKAVDAVGNESSERTLSFNVDPDMPVNQTFLPLVSQ
jgi:hypothetical protein